MYSIGIDPDNEDCFSVWFDNAGGSGAEVVGKIADERVAAAIRDTLNANPAILARYGFVE